LGWGNKYPSEQPVVPGLLYLVATMDWNSRKVIAWRLSNPLSADSCAEAREAAVWR